MAGRYVVIFVLSFAASVFFILLLKKLVLKYKRLSSGNVPAVGGLSIGLALFLVFLPLYFVYGNLLPRLGGVVAASAVMLVFGVFDDWREFSVPVKFITQALAVSLLIFLGIRSEIVYIGLLLNVLITCLWVIGITNAFNHLDVMDGASGVCAGLVALSLFFISIFNGDACAAILAVCVCGAICGFLLFNLPPAKVYLGNGGSHFLGFLLAGLALSISYAPLERKTALLSPVLIFGLPIFDTAFLIWTRLKQGRSIFKKSDDHLSLRFLKIGLSRPKALYLMSGLGLFFALCGIGLSQSSGAQGAGIAGLVILVSVILSWKMGK